MNSRDVYILGAGGMAREAYRYYTQLHGASSVKGFIIQKKFWKSPQSQYGIPVLSDESITPDVIAGSVFLSAIGLPNKREWIQALVKRGASFVNLIANSPQQNDTITIGTGSIIAPGAILTDAVSIGEHVIINVSASLNHDVHIGDFSHIGPGVHIAGNVTIGEGTWVGIGASIIHNIRIGDGCYIAAGAVVVDNLDSGYLYMGVPAKPVRKLADADWETLL